MKKLMFVFVFMSFNMLYAQVESEFEKYKAKQNSYIEQRKNEYDKFYSDKETEYENYVKAEREAHEKFIKGIKDRWGKDNVVETTNKDWVEYSDDGSSRSIVDFEKGEVTIEIIVTPNESKSEEIVENKVEDKLKELIKSRGKTKDYDTSVEKSVPLQETPVLEDQIQTPSGEIISNNNIDDGVKEIVEEAKIVKEEIKGDDGVTREVVVVKFELVPDHIRTRAEKYKNEVEKYCRKYNIEPALAYAVMQTESSFNPKAKSYVPAYGLMQIVPASAGKDCAESLKKSFSKPTANYLYEPENNIEMGVHYLYLLRKRYYTNVENADSRDLCVIASYNTGAGNVARALRGDTKISKAIPQINEMSYEELFKYFEKKLLPETQNYIRKVTERMNDFREWMK